MIVSPIQEPPPLLDEAVVSQHRLRQLRAIDDELGRREIEALNLYEPLPFQREYHACRAPEVCFVKGNQVGASLAGFVEVARAITGKDPHNKYPQRDGTAVCLGMGEKHIGRVIYKYLFRAGAFRIIRDLETNEWRTFRPWPPDQVVCGHLGDGGREAKSKPAPPLIPHRFIDGKISWEKRSENVFRYIKFKTGWELYAENSAGDPGQVQGFQCDLYHIDEDVAMGGWLEEATGRLMARTGKLRWTAVPDRKSVV